jgi:hypothetical protein
MGQGALKEVPLPKMDLVLILPFLKILLRHGIRPAIP